MSEQYQYKLSVITATYNAVEHLPTLIESLRNQEDKGFEWVVADGASTDGTLELLEAIDDLNIKITSEEDFGIYDALNRGIKACSGEFYLVMGADDVLYPNAVGLYKKHIEEGTDVITANIHSGDAIKKISKKPVWISRQFGFVTSHAVGSVFRKNLHERVGFYSMKYPIASDQEFILKSLLGHESSLKYVSELVGQYGLDGLSSIDRIGSATESFRIMVELGFNKYAQLMFLVFRLLRIYVSK